MNYSAGGWWTSGKINTNVNEMINRAGSHREETAACVQSEINSMHELHRLLLRWHFQQPQSLYLRLSRALQAGGVAGFIVVHIL